MTWRFSPRTSLSVALSVFAAVALLLINEAGWRESDAATQRVQQAQQMRIAAGRLMRAAIDAETGQRGFLLTGEASYLEPYRRAQSEIASIEAQLDAVLNHFPTERASFEELKQALALRQDELNLTIGLRKEGREAAWRFVVNSDVGAQHMDRVRDLAEKLIASGDAHIQKSFEQINRSLRVSRIGVAALVVLSLLAFCLYLRQSFALLRHNELAQQRLQKERDLLEQQVQERTASLRDLATHLQRVREEERGFLARELHDELGALLTAAKLDVARVKSRIGPHAEAHERLAHLTDTLNNGITLKRRIVEDLRPSSLSHLGLVASLEILAREFAERSELRVHTDLEAVRLSDELQITIYRLVQESLTNIGKYAQAHEVHVSLRREPPGLKVMVTDDGQGFEPSQVSPSRHGLAGMRHRVEALGGQLQVQSQPGQGARIVALLPLSEVGAPPSPPSPPYAGN